MLDKFPCVSKRQIVPGIMDLPKLNYEVLEEIHLELVTQVVTYIRTTPAFIVYPIQVFSSHDDRV